MSVPPDPEQLERLLPALSHVADAMKKNGALSRRKLQLLLLGIDIKGDWALDELERWVRVLAEASTTTDAVRREMAQRALMLRGIPEAPAMLAIATVAGTSGTQPVPLNASIEQLDFEEAEQQRQSLLRQRPLESDFESERQARHSQPNNR